MGEVIVSGRVVSMHGDHVLVPVSDDPNARADCAVTLEGTNLPPLDSNASAWGELTEQRLTVKDWSPDPDPHPAWNPRPDLLGVEPESASRAIDTLPAEESDLVSFGEAQVASGKRTALVQLISISPKVSAWLSEQPTGSIYVYPFIRDAGTPSVWAAGDNHLAPS